MKAVKFFVDLFSSLARLAGSLPVVKSILKEHRKRKDLERWLNKTRYTR